MTMKTFMRKQETRKAHDICHTHNDSLGRLTSGPGQPSIYYRIVFYPGTFTLSLICHSYPPGHLRMYASHVWDRNFISSVPTFHILGN